MEITSSYSFSPPISSISTTMAQYLVPTFTVLSAMITSFLALLMLVTYYRTWNSFFGQEKHKVGTPRVFPYCLPFIGNGLSVVLNPSKCAVATTKSAGTITAFGVRLLGETIYFVTGRDNIAKLRKHQGYITDPRSQSWVMARVFGLSQQANEMYNRDDSGIQVKPASNSIVAPNNRIDYHTHTNFVKMLSGEGLNTMFSRWHASFSRRLDLIIHNIQDSDTDQWTVNPDLEGFWMTPLTAAMNEAIAGPILESVNPNFTQNLVEFMPYVHSFLKGLPKWWMPRAFALRKSLNRDCKTWHSLARALSRDSDNKDSHFRSDSASPDSPWWGLAAMRDRQVILEKVDNWDHDSMAASDLGFLWGANINVHTAALWCLIEIIRDPDLLARIRSELSTITLSPTSCGPSAWIEALMALPILQSVYAEVLRLRVDTGGVFRDNHGELQINQWRFPKHSLVIVPTRPAHMDEAYWNTRGGKKPLNCFWADRFLEYADDPESGPALKGVATIRSREKKHLQQAPHSQQHQQENEQKNKGVCGKFVTAGTSDSWIPYGVGERACPGRFFARREITAFCAILLQNFDMELLYDDGHHIPANSLFYGMGVERPRNKFPFRIRRRRTST
ncbi:cytochrome P450 [Rhypophila sp. PSN 637]